jgi:hypothetical protein
VFVCKCQVGRSFTLTDPDVNLLIHPARANWRTKAAYPSFFSGHVGYGRLLIVPITSTHVRRLRGRRRAPIVGVAPIVGMGDRSRRGSANAIVAHAAAPAVSPGLVSDRTAEYLRSGQTEKAGFETGPSAAGIPSREIRGSFAVATPDPRLCRGGSRSLTFPGVTQADEAYYL